MQENPILVHKESNEWKLFLYNVKFIDNGAEQEAYTSDLDWYQKFAQMHKNFTLVDVVEMSYTAVQLARLEEVKHIEIADTVINDYVINGAVGEGLETLALQKENQELRSLLADLTETVLLGGA